MKKYFLKQLDSPRDVLRVLISASLIVTLFGLITVGRALDEASEQGDGSSTLMVIAGTYLFLNFSGITWAAFSKLKSQKKK